MNTATTDALAALLAAAKPAATEAPMRVATLNDSHRVVFSFAYSYGTKEAIKALPGSKFDPTSKTWSARVSHEAAGVIKTEGFEQSDEVIAAIAVLPARVDRTAMSTAVDALVPYTGPMADDLYEFQKAGVQFILSARSTLLGDEMGLGKTRQAMAAIEAEEAYPVVIACPSSLTLNWVREYRNLLPNRTVAVAQGVKNVDVSTVKHADVVIIGYGSLRSAGRDEAGLRLPSAWAEGLQGFAKSAVLDESHYIKNHESQRAKAAMLLVEHMAPTDLRIAVTGTPVVNRPSEFLSQLQWLDTLAETGFTSAYNWLRHYCLGSGNSRGMDFSGARDMATLNARMRENFYIRRLKDDVEDTLGLVAKAPRIPVYFQMTGPKAAEYARAKKDIVAWASEQGGAEAAMAASRGEVLVKMNALRRLAGEAKIDSTIEWVKNWLDQHPDRKLVLFAHFKTVQNALVEAFDCPAILGGQTPATTEAAKKTFFEDDDARVMVVSLGAGREGHTLHADGKCSDVVFVEQGWTPSAHAQAEDRVHRIGQTRKVTPWYLLADDSIDTVMRDLIEAKRIVVDAATEGGTLAEDNDSIMVAAFFRMSI